MKREHPASVLVAILGVIAAVALILNLSGVLGQPIASGPGGPRGSQSGQQPPPPPPESESEPTHATRTGEAVVPPRTSASSASERPTPLSSPPTTSASPSGNDLEKFLADCEAQLENWRPGQVRFPQSVTVPLDQSATYRASIDIRPGAQAQPAPEKGVRTAAVEVRCGLGARLVRLGDNVSIENEGVWQLREFDTPGVVEWAWDIKASKPENAGVRLEMRPAVAVVGGGRVVPANDDSRAPTVSFDSDIVVDASLVDQADFFADNSWPKIVGIATLLGGALIALITFAWKFARAIRGRDPNQATQAPSSAQTRPERPVRSPRNSRRRRQRQSKTQKRLPPSPPPETSTSPPASAAKPDAGG